MVIEDGLCRQLNDNDIHDLFGAKKESTVANLTSDIVSKNVLFTFQTNVVELGAA